MASSIDTLVYSLLVEKNIVKKTVLDAVISKAPASSGAVWISELAASKAIDEGSVLKQVAERLGIRYMSLKNVPVDSSLYKKIPVKIASHYQFVPIAVDGAAVVAGVYYPLDLKTLDEIRLQIGCDIKQVLSSRAEILEAMRQHYGLGAQMIEKLFLKRDANPLAPRAASQVQEVSDIKEKGDDATVAELVNQIIFDAYQKRATDIHIEPYRGQVRFRYRIDGVLYDANVSDTVKHFLTPVLSRIKIMASLDIVEHRLPQDGQTVVRIGEERLDLRISCIPTTHGESIVIRILPAVVLYDIEKLGLLPRDRQILDRLLEQPHGIIFVTGPTGSGKTTTLYASLNKLNTPDKKIITIEDPVEYEMTGITQIQVSPNIGFDFAKGLRSMLRHDPDIMMVGEVRDLETAEIAVRVALTGHLVFSTLHTNSAAASVHRLLDIGIEPYLIHSSILAFMAQRLVRVLCTHCKQVIDVPDQGLIDLIRRELKLKGTDRMTFCKSKGCDHCNNTGYFGRTAIYEILELNDSIKKLIQERASVTDIEKAAVKNGMKTLLQNGLEKVASGITTIEEIVNILQIRPHEETTADEGTAEVDVEIEKKEEPEAPRRNIRDRRVYRRLKRSFPLMFRIFKRDISEDFKERMHMAGIDEAAYWEDHHGACDDLSAGGLSFRYDLPLLKETVLSIKLTLPFGSETKKSPTVISCLSKVMRVSESDDKTFFDIAVLFLDMTIADRNLLNTFIERIAAGEGE